VQAIKYLLSVPEIKREANAVNMLGYTALDILEACDVCSRDSTCFKIQNILKEAGIRRSKDLISFLPPAPSSAGVDEAQPMQPEQPAMQGNWQRWWGCIHSLLGKYMKHQGNWIEETRGTLMIVATVITTMTFQVGISPPGGVWQQDMKKDAIHCTRDLKCEAGRAVLAYSYPDVYRYFLSVNSFSFFASVCVLLLIISGFPLTSKFIIWFFTLFMAGSVASMASSYLRAVVLVTPDHILNRSFVSFFGIFLIILQVVVVIAVVYHIIGPLSWVLKKLRNFKRKLSAARYL